MPTIVLSAAAAAALVLSSITIFSYQLAYSQMTTRGSQNFFLCLIFSGHKKMLAVTTAVLNLELLALYHILDNNT
jgi:hypothetical protein